LVHLIGKRTDLLRGTSEFRSPAGLHIASNKGVAFHGTACLHGFSDLAEAACELVCVISAEW